jgi:hypothetical protein
MNNRGNIIENLLFSLKDYLSLYHGSKKEKNISNESIKFLITRWENQRYKQYLKNIRKIPTETKLTKSKLIEWIYSQPETIRYLKSWIESGTDKKYIPIIHRCDKKKTWTLDNMRIGLQHESIDQRRYKKEDRSNSKLPTSRQVFIYPLISDKNGNLRPDFKNKLFAGNLSEAQKKLNITHKTLLADKLNKCAEDNPDIQPFCFYKNCYFIIEKNPAPTLF